MSCSMRASPAGSSRSVMWCCLRCLYCLYASGLPRNRAMRSKMCCSAMSRTNTWRSLGLHAMQRATSGHAAVSEHSCVLDFVGVIRHGTGTPAVYLQSDVCRAMCRTRVCMQQPDRPHAPGAGVAAFVYFQGPGCAVSWVYNVDAPPPDGVAVSSCHLLQADSTHTAVAVRTQRACMYSLARPQGRQPQIPMVSCGLRRFL